MNKLTVAEYAKSKCISVQAVYKKIDRLKTIEEERNGRKQILIIVDDEEQETAEEEIKPNSTPIKPSSTVDFNPDNSTSTPQEEENTTNKFNPDSSTSTPTIQPSSTVDFNPSVLQILQEQIQEKDKQIERLQQATEIVERAD